MGEYTVYIHKNKINNKRYVGITSTSLKDRWQEGYGYKTQSIFFDDIIKYGWDNFEHEIVYENLSQREAQEKEIELIFKYKTWIGFEDCCGYNTSITSTGPSPKKYSNIHQMEF